MRLNIEKALIFLLWILIIIFLFHKGILSVQECRAGPMYQFWHLGIERPTGDVGFKFREDIFNSRYEGANTESRTKYRLFNEELNLQTKMFIYDPRFIQLTLGGGIMFGQGHVDYQGSDRLTKFNLSAILFKEHPYQGAVHFRKQQIDFEHSPTSIYLLDQTEYGASVRLQEGVLRLPIPLELRFNHLNQLSDNIYKFLNRDDTTNGFYKFNETTNVFDIESDKKWENIDLFWQFSNTDAIRINETGSGKDEIDYSQRIFNTRLSGKFGDEDRFRWKTKLDWSSQTNWPKYQHLNFGGELRYQIYDEIFSSLDSVFGIDVSKRERIAESDPQTDDFIKLRTGVEHRLFKSLFNEFKLKYEKLMHTDFDETSKEILLGTKYTKEIPKGNIFTNYTPSYRTTERTGQKISFSTDEFHVISDYSPIVLDSENIIIDTVVITDQSSSAIYQEGLDYRIYQIGRETYIERIAGSAIINGDIVLVDYKFKNPRGSLKEFNQNFAFGVRWWIFEPYVRITSKDQTLLRGDDLLLNSGNSIIYGLKLTPNFLNKKIISEFRVEMENNAYELEPFNRRTASVSISYHITKNMSILSYCNKSIVDYKNPGHDSDYFMAGADFNYEYRLIRWSTGIGDEISEIGNSKRDTKFIRSGASYKFGDWIFDASIRTAIETQEYNSDNQLDRFYDRDNMVIKFTISRKF